MKFFVADAHDSEVTGYTYRVLNELIEIHDHEKVDDPQKAHAVLFSFLDVSHVKDLKKGREKYPNSYIIVGGPVGVYWKLVYLFADLVNVGQGFELFECNSIDEMKSLPSTYTGNEDEIIPSQRIDWEKVPVGKSSSKTYYYWGSVGCSQNCGYCLPAWTRQVEKNNKMRIKKAEHAIPDGDYLQLVSNEYSEPLTNSASRDIMIRDFLEGADVGESYQMLRMGVEFATEELRNRWAKPATNEEVYQAIEKSKELNVQIQFFLITGLNTEEEWLDFLTNVPNDRDRYPRVRLNFTNLNFHQYTPMYRLRYDIELDNYFARSDIDRWHDRIAYHNQRMRTYGPAYPAQAFWRSAMLHVETREEFETIWDHRNNKNAEEMLAVWRETTMDNFYADEYKFPGLDYSGFSGK